MNNFQDPNARPPVYHYNGPAPLPQAAPPDAAGRKRALSGADASQPPVPHPSYRQPLGTIQNPIAIDHESMGPRGPLPLPPQWSTYPYPMAATATIPLGIPTTIDMGTPENPMLVQINLQNMVPAARPPLEDQLAGIANPNPTYTREALSAKIDKLPPATIKALLLKAAVAHFTVADQVDLEYTKNLQREAVKVVKARAKAAQDLDFDRFLEESSDWLTRYYNVGWSKAHDKAFTVEKNLKRIFGRMVDAVCIPGTAFETKANALRVIAGIYKNILTNVPCEVTKIVREMAHYEYHSYFTLVLDQCSPEELVKLRTHAVAGGQQWVEYIRQVQKVCKSYCSELEETLGTALARVEGTTTEGEQAS